MLRSCPLRHFTPRVREALAWFEQCYDLDVGFGVIRWKRVALPRAGAIADQDPWLLEAMGALQNVWNQMAQEKPERGTRHGQAKE